MDDRISVRLIEALDASALERLAGLYRLAGFAEAGDDAVAWLPGMLAGSLLAAAAFHEGELVGFGRALGDGVSDAFLQDVVVDPEWRRRGVGRMVVELLVRELRARGADWIGLVAVPGKAGFYRKLGFTELEDYVPMRLKLPRK